MDSTLSIIGSIASVGSAIWAFYEAKKSTNAARQAQQLRNELIHRRKVVEVSQVHSETHRILRVVSKIGPSSNSKLLKGVNISEIAKEVEEYARYLLEQSGHFSSLFNNSATELCEDLKADIEALSEAVTADDKKRYGKSIYYKIQGFMPMLKQLADENRERIPESSQGDNP